MRVHFSNAAYGVLDYAAYPVGMLLVTPVVLHHLGTPVYGLWSMATAAISAGGIIASGFGDANIQHVAMLRSGDDRPAIGNAVRSMMSINLALGATVAALGWATAPYMSQRLAIAEVLSQSTCLVVMRIASLLMVVRALESVSISTLRAFERYGAAIQISIAGRLLSLAAAAALALTGHGIASIMIATAALLSLATAAQFIRLYFFLGTVALWPALDRKAINALCDTGIFSWLQALAGVLFGQADRLLIGVSIGATALASYTLCVQLSQPIFGITSASLHFLFPYLSSRVGAVSRSELKRTLLRAFACNTVLIAVGTALLFGFGDDLLRAWAGDAIAQAAAPVFRLIVLGSSLLGLSVTGTYALLALRRFRTVAGFSVAGGIGMLMLMGWLARTHGVAGLATARLVFGASMLFLYMPLLRFLNTSSDQASPHVALEELKEVTRA